LLTILTFISETSVQKKADKASVTNYRPTMLVTAFSKVLEKVIYNTLRYHIHTNNILVPKNLASGKGYPLKMQLSDFPVCSNPLTKRCMLEVCSVI
jgi:hypothetical protein